MSLVPFRRFLAPALLAGACAVFLVSPAPAVEEVKRTEPSQQIAGEIPSLDPLSHRGNTRAVRITDDSLEPRVVTLGEGQIVAWVSYSSAPSTVVFERAVARSMICHSLVNFSIQDEEIRSAEIHAGEFASFCELRPGRYRYTVARGETGKTSIGNASRLEGEIIVRSGGR